MLLDAQITGAPDATRLANGQHGRFDQAGEVRRAGAIDQIVRVSATGVAQEANVNC